MKKANKFFLLLGATIVLSACNKSFLNKIPEDRVTNENFWKTDNDFQTYSLGLYNFGGFGVGNSYSIANNSDETCATNMGQNDRIYERRVIPATGGGWDWSYLRSVNILIAEAEQSNLPLQEKLQWEAVGRFFRAREYFTKVGEFGNVPWVGHPLNAEDSILYEPQDPRSLVMYSVLADLNFAIKNLPVVTEPNQINRDVAFALKSRICLFEGTFRKYHTELNLGGTANMWLEECASASDSLITSSRYHLDPDYRTIYSSVDLAGDPEIILYKHYEFGVIENIRTRQIGLSQGPTPFVCGTKDGIESYLCDDGLPYGVSPTHPEAILGEPESIDSEFAHRDPRLGMTFVIPYRNDSPKQDPPLVETQLSFAPPPFMPSFDGEGGIADASGYNPYKWWNPNTNYEDINGTLDAPLFAYHEVLLNYAEAMAELGECTQTVLDESINKLRDQVGMPHLTLAIAASINDPMHEKYAPEISNLLWEIRRERHVELMLDGTRLDDIIRWKKASYFSKPFVGAYIDLSMRPASAYNADGSPKAKVTLGDREGNVIVGATKGYVLPYGGDQPPAHSDDDIKAYYNPIPTQQLVLNKNLVQSPGW